MRQPVAERQRGCHLVTAMLAVILAAGCGGRPAKPDASGGVTIKVAYWGGPEEIAIMQGVIQNWERQHPDIHVRLEHTPFSVYVNRLLTRMAGEVALDIMATEANIFVSFWAKDTLLPLNTFIDHDPTFDLADFFPKNILL